MKKIILVLCMMLSLPSYAMSYNKTLQIYTKIIADNYLVAAPPLYVINDADANAYSTRRGTYITSGMLRYVKNQDEMARVLGHELGHFTLKHKMSTISNEFEADQMAIIYMTKSGFNRCVGAKLFLRRNMPVSYDHPADIDRWKAFNC